ncbi:MAG: hypothetical protein IKZ53_09425, partial [Selenomonadaceae bacterium]|nr:hypothetical protein [Selenomonadaceae bacterium]
MADSIITGTSGSDSITVSSSNRYVQALSGRDYIVVESKYDNSYKNITIDAGDGNDTIKTLNGNYSWYIPA